MHVHRSHQGKPAGHRILWNRVVVLGDMQTPHRLVFGFAVTDHRVKVVTLADAANILPHASTARVLFDLIG